MQMPEALAKNDVPAKVIELDKDQPNLEIEAAPPKPAYRFVLMHALF